MPVTSRHFLQIPGPTNVPDRILRAIDRAGHPALYLVDVISSLGSIDYRHDEWGVDVTAPAREARAAE